MGAAQFQRDNHYVPCVYLKGFASTDKRVETYRVLVSHPRVSLWKKHSIRGIAYYSHLYTRITVTGPNDDVEKWLQHEFETPAEAPLQRAIMDQKLTADDWRRLIRFVAAQDVRTPARLLENMQRWEKEMPDLLDNVLRSSVENLKRAKSSGEFNRTQGLSEQATYIPIRVTPNIIDREGFRAIKVEVIAGRGLWLFSIKHTLTSTLRALHQHRWTILKPPDELTWFTSDDPVIRLNFYGDGNYDFRGGWGNQGTEILLPISPRHLLYTKIGEPPPPRGTVVARPHAEMIRRFIAEHAHRAIFASSPVEDVAKLRPRIVDATLFHNESEKWRSWHDEQARAERKHRGW